MRILEIHPVDECDLPALTRIFYAGFTTAIDQQMFPDTPGLRAWWADANRHDILHKPGVRFLKVIDRFITPAGSDVGNGDGDDDSDSNSNNAGNNENVISYAKWDLDPSNRGRRFPEWHPDSDAELCDRFFGGCDLVHKEIMDGRGHYYLDMLVTHPAHQRRGAATMLVRWGCNLADETGMSVYIDATRAGAPVYEMMGFVVVREDAEAGLLSMVREPMGV
ncbi:GNAT family N-acetyltransferase [Aspergillus saccharolyticus JOP 1030-1]|uniref:N-acetyltransferase domain-containing protein n=1 Tax=Aspergillus saccharolyticus JOP 1030-1 TaxID=1450539 RepID=A0A318ZNI3_9EURO|nr:hypothetical protein BP01DRAFT_352704 [Aspergillus saccharolyticus JOP 1030-1]PYH49181.1 hypothetical protein BP01DRAFT_352704 [Aspergillus saccharolyticus JOP 1030-1]